MTTQQMATEVFRLAGDLEAHLDDKDTGNLLAVVGYVVNRLCELAEDLQNTGSSVTD